jgi:hypothetical protein
MLYGKINPTAKFAQQAGPFETPSSIEAGYIAVIANRYIAGASKTNFQIVFGNLVIENTISKFKEISSSSVELTSEELSTWGTDDKILLNLVADKIGTKCEEFGISNEQYF